MRCRVLSLLRSSAGTLVLCGSHCTFRRPPFVRKFKHLPADRVEQVLLAWHRSPLAKLQQLGRGLRGLVVAAIIDEACAHTYTVLTNA